MAAQPPSTSGGADASGAGARLLARIAQAYGQDGPAEPSGDFSGQLFGNYRLIERIGRGGMGDVYQAERADGAFEARVAVKLLRASIDSESLTRRFVQERQILAHLNHPHIARLLGGGSGPLGLPYLVMEWVDGQPLTDFAIEQALDLDQRLNLFLAVCDAVAYAHRNLVVHRDLKPSNILVDGSGQVKLLDFGVSKMLVAGDETAEPLTRTGALMMTPAYAAPEQILGQAVTTATDIYALGVLLYELLTGQRPHRREADSPAALATMVETEPFTRPSELVAKGARRLADRRLARRLRGDLDTVLLVALRREPERRYPTVEALAEDLRRFRTGLPVRARPDALGYRMGKFLLRHRVGVAASLAVFLALAVGLGMALWQASVAREQARQALDSKQFVLSLLTGANPAQQASGIDYRVVDLLRDAAGRVEEELDRVPDLQAELRVEIANALLEIGALEEARLLAEAGLDQLRRQPGDRGERLAYALYVIARIHARLGNPDATSAAAVEALAIIDRLHPEPSLQRARLLGIQARAENLRARFDQALRLYQRALQERLALDDGDAAGLASIHNNIASTAVMAERFAEAESSYREAARLLLDQHGADHPRMAWIDVGLAAALIGQGRFGEARGLLDRAESTALARLGPESGLLADLYTHRAKLAEHVGDRAAALHHWEQALALARRIGAANSEASAALRLGLLLLDLGSLEQAGESLQSACNLLEHTLRDAGSRHSLCQVALARVDGINGAVDATERSLAVLVGMQAQGQGGRLDFAEAASLHAALLLDLGQTEAAWPWLERALSLSSGVLGPQHPETQRFRNQLEAVRRASQAGD